MIGYWFYKFEIEDRNVGVVDYELMENTDVEYPALSVCIENPFIQKELAKTTINSSFSLNKASYLQFLKGEIFDEEIVKRVDYDNVTINLDNYFSYGLIKFRNESSARNMTTFERFKHKITFNGFYKNGIFVKCFSPVIPKSDYPNLHNFAISYESDALLKDLSVSKMRNQLVYPRIHYPEQFLLEDSRGTNIPMLWLKYGRNKWIRLSIESMEFMNRRRNRHQDCMENTNNFDSIVLNRHVKTCGCSPPYLQSVENYPTNDIDFGPCKSKEKLRKSKYDFFEVRTKYYPKACHRISRLDLKPVGNGTHLGWGFLFNFAEEVKIISQSQEVDVHSLIGSKIDIKSKQLKRIIEINRQKVRIKSNSFLSNFLLSQFHNRLISILFYYSGYALIQIPDFLLFVYYHVKKVFKTKNRAKVVSRVKNQKTSNNLDTRNRRTHELDKGDAKNKCEPMDKVNKELAYLCERISKLEELLRVTN